MALRQKVASMSSLGVILDFNGVIADDEELHYKAVQRVCNELGIHLAREEYLRSYPGSLPAETFRSILDRYPRTVSAETCVAKKMRYYEEEFQNGVQTFPGVADVIRNLQNADFRLAIGSTSQRRFITAVLRDLAVQDCFSVIVGGEDVRAGKPNPEVYLLAAQRLGIPCRHSLVVEDSVNGIVAAKAAGMKCAAVASTFPRERLSSADMILGTIDELYPRTVLQLLQ